MENDWQGVFGTGYFRLTRKTSYPSLAKVYSTFIQLTGMTWQNARFAPRVWVQMLAFKSGA